MSLPTDVLLHIFSYACRTLPQLFIAALVCRRWSQVVWNTQAHLEMDGPAGWAKLATRVPHVTGLTLERFPNITHILPLLPQLVHLNLQEGSSAVSSLDLRLCTSLMRLQLPFRPSHIPYDLTSCTFLSLKELWLNSACEFVELPLLSLSLTGLNLTLFSGPTTTLRPLSALSNLRWLNLSRAFKITAAELALLVVPLRSLVSLDVSGCRRIDTLRWLSGLPRLQILSIGSLPFSDTQLRAIKSLHRLVQLCMQGCHRVTDAGILQLKEIKSIQILDLRGSLASPKLKEHFPGVTVYLDQYRPLP